MKQTNIENLASLNKELEYRNKISKDSIIKSFKNRNTIERGTTSAVKFINKILIKSLKTKDDFNKKIAEKQLNLIKSVSKNFEECIKTNSELVKQNSKSSEFVTLELNQQFDMDTFKEFKRKVEEVEIIATNSVLLKKELSEKEVKIEKAKATYKLLDKQSTNYFVRKKIKYYEIKIAKLRTRIIDVKEFINVEAVSRKLYLSDEPPMTPAGWIKLFLSYAIMLFWCVIILWPLAELVKASFNNNAISYLDTSTYEFGFDSFTRLFNDTNYLKWLENTLIISLVTMIITVCATLLMGYAFSRFRFKGKKVSLLTIMLFQMIPTMAALTVFYVLFTLLHNSIGINGNVALIIIYVGGGIAGNTFIMKGYMDSISMEIDEAAKIDGLSQWRIFTRIIVPLTKPMIALVALWSFIGPFGDVILPGLLLSKNEEYTIAKGLNSLITMKPADQGAYAAGALLIAVPISLLFISLRKFLVGGITAGGVKG